MLGGVILPSAGLRNRRARDRSASGKASAAWRAAVRAASAQAASAAPAANRTTVLGKTGLRIGMLLVGDPGRGACVGLGWDSGRRGPRLTNGRAGSGVPNLG